MANYINIRLTQTFRICIYNQLESLGNLILPQSSEETRDLSLLGYIL